jgi:hypothetical protein
VRFVRAALVIVGTAMLATLTLLVGGLFAVVLVTKVTVLTRDTTAVRAVLQLGLTTFALGWATVQVSRPLRRV